MPDDKWDQYADKSGDKWDQYADKATPSAMQRYVGGIKGAIPVLSGSPLPSPQQAWDSAVSGAHNFMQHPLDTVKAQFNASPIGKIAHGDIAGGLGAATPDVVMGAISAGQGMDPANVKSAITAPVRAVAKAGNFTIRNAPEVLTPIGAAAGLAKSGTVEGALFGGYMGNRLGKFVNRLPQIPGEQLGLPQKSVLPNVGPIKGTPAGPPASVGQAPVKSRIVDMSQRAPGVRPPKGAVEQPAVASPTASGGETPPSPLDVAHSLGYKNVTAAMSKLTPQGWQAEYDKWAGTPVKPQVTEPPAVAAPAAPVSEFQPIDFKQQQNLMQGNPLANWRDVQEDLGIRDRMERNYGTDTQPIVKPSYFRKSDNLPVSRDWANEHMDEVYAREVPHDINDITKSSMQRQAASSRQGRAVESERNRAQQAKENVAQNKGILAKRTR